MSVLPVYSLILGFGASFGLLWITASSPAAQRLHWLLAAWIALLGTLIGARAGFVLEHWPYFSVHLSQMPQFWLGGLTWEGALAGGILCLPLVARLWQWPFSLVLDRLSRLILPLGMAGWLGSWWNGLAYGAALPEKVWWGLAVRDETGLVSLRTPLQPLAILSLAVFLGVLELWLSSSGRTGLRGCLTCLVFSADMLLFSFLRADPSPAWLGLRIETWCAMVYTLIGLLITITYFIKNIKASLTHGPVHVKEKESSPL